MSVVETDSQEAIQQIRRILIVDDAPIFREIESVFLGRSGTILTANDGTSALKLARNERPDLIVTDLSMREMDGDELCRELRGDPDLKRTPVIVVTSGSNPEEHERAIRAGANDVVEKPIRRLSLLQSVNRFLRARMRSLPRARLETDVLLSVDGERSRGRSSNVSRGGIFVETERTWEPETEMRVEFEMPECAHRFAPTARVVWRRQAKSELAPGMGLQFLKLEPAASEWLAEYVYEFAPPEELAATVAVQGAPGTPS